MTKVNVLYLGTLVLNLINFILLIFFSFELIEHYEPYFVDFTEEEMKLRTYSANDLIAVDLFSKEDFISLGLVISSVTFLTYLILQVIITMLEAKNPDLKNLMVRNLFMTIPILFGIGFLVVTFWYTFLGLFDVINSKLLLGILLKFGVSLLIIAPVVLYNVLLLKREGKSLKEIFVK